MTLFRTPWELRIGQVESPIEAAFLRDFCDQAVFEGFDVARMSSAQSGVIVIEPQRWFGNYRVDFYITYRFFGMTKRLVVECDGHEFHEKTKVQAWRDKRRDRLIPHKVYRFTGAELHAQPHLCAREILDVIMDFQTWSFGVHLRRAAKEARRKGKAA